VLFNTESCDVGATPKRHHLVVYRIYAPESPNGYVAWYHDIAAETGGVEVSGFSLTEEGTILASVDKQHLYEWSFEGEALEHEDFSAACSGAAGDVGPCPHHDAKRSELGTVWGIGAKLSATAATTWDSLPCTSRFINDGVLGAFPYGSSRWLMDDLGYDPSVDPGPRAGDVMCETEYWTGRFESDADLDWTHMNALETETVGGAYDVLLLSLREWDQILRYRPGTNTVQYRLSPHAGRSDLALTIAAGLSGITDFHGQHDLTSKNGTLLFLDNRVTGGNQRAVRVVPTPNPGAGPAIATIDREWVLTNDVGVPLAACTNSGGVQMVPGTAGSTVLATCKQLNRIMELAHGDASELPPEMVLELVDGDECATAGATAVQGWYRGYPLVDVGTFR
jgi:hypothetical protein